MTPTDELIAALPERIWVASRGTGFSAGADSIVDYTWGEWQSVKRPYAVEYVRADRLASLTAPVGEWETTAEERKNLVRQAEYEPQHQVAETSLWLHWREILTRLLRDFDRALASLSAERDQNKRLVEAGREAMAWVEECNRVWIQGWRRDQSERAKAIDAALAQPEEQR